MKKTILMALLCALTLPIWAQTIEFTGNGDGTSWEDPANWDLPRIPNASDDVLINSNFQVFISSAAEISDLFIRSTAELTINAGHSLTADQQTNNTNSILVVEGAKITNLGAFTVKNCPNNGIQIFDDAEFINEGILRIENIGEDGLELFDATTFTNQGSNSRIIIDGTDNSGIEMEADAEFYNEGIIQIKNSRNLIEMDDSAFFENRGTITLRDGIEDGICIDDDDTSFSNYGSISIFDMNSNAIEIDDGWFTNITGGMITIHTIDDGIDLQSDGIFINNGKLDITITSNAADVNGLDLEEDTYFENSDDIIIHLSEEASGPAIELESSNTDLINLGCGLINITSNHSIAVLDASSSITNNGVLATLFNGTNINEGTITNSASGTVLSPNAVFMASPNALVNNGSLLDINVCSGQYIVSTCDGGPCGPPIEELPLLPGMLKYSLLLLVLLGGSWFSLRIIE